MLASLRLTPAINENGLTQRVIDAGIVDFGIFFGSNSVPDSSTKLDLTTHLSIGYISVRK
ncbi:MAG: hypothetical protein DWI54_05825 [Chloroflexi bacterium]|nr:MAG: hypothetical protein DWI54_05825 [Chloroflexota bacterium]